MKRKIFSILFGLLFLIGFGILAYPTVSNQWNTYRQNKLISNYKAITEDTDTEEFAEEWEKAEQYNDSITVNQPGSEDVFSEGVEEDRNSEYWNVLNIAGDGMMGYLSIPKINVELAIYHGTSDEVLQTGVGHLEGTKLPIGGESTHSVLAAHRGLPSARLFTDLDQLEEGDQFYIHIFDEVLAYQVDQILPMVDKDDTRALQEALQIEEGQDYVTLFTCTPYGVNTHRLLVRGTRIEYGGEEDVPETAADTLTGILQDYYMFFLIGGICVTVIAVGVIRICLNRKKRKLVREKEKSARKK